MHRSAFKSVVVLGYLLGGPACSDSEPQTRGRLWRAKLVRKQLSMKQHLEDQLGLLQGTDIACTEPMLVYWDENCSLQAGGCNLTVGTDARHAALVKKPKPAEEVLENTVKSAIH